MSSKLSILLGAGNTVLAIILDALAAHAIKNTLNEHTSMVFNTAVEYHLYHALGLIVVGILIKLHTASILLSMAAHLMLLGILLFCGGLYALSLSGISELVLVAPFGGLAFIAAWICVFLAFIK